MKVTWERFDPPLPAVAVAAHGTAAEVLDAKTHQATWTVDRFVDWIVVGGEDLPWVDGAIYLGRLPGTARVLVPVHRQPRLHAELVERVAARFRGAAHTAALIPDVDGVTVLPLKAT